MPGFLFTNAWMLGGLAALGIPVLIHLLLKLKKKRLRFSTLQFFRPQDEQSSQRRKLRNWLLLALRLLIFTLLVLAFARPYLPQSAAAGAARKRREVVFVLDRSASMWAIGTEGPRWGLAKQRIQKVLSGLAPEDRAALLGCAGHTEVLSGFAPPAAVTRLLSGLQPGYGISSLAQGLRQALKLIELGDPDRAAAIYVVSDLQRSASQNLAAVPIPQDVEVGLLPVGDLISPNLAITQLQVEAGEGVRPEVVVTSFSDEDAPAVALDVSVDGKPTYSRAIALKAGASTTVPLVLPALTPGWHQVKASLASKDALELDNSRWASLLVPEPTRVLVVESRQAKRVFEAETFFLTSALDPVMEATNSVPAPYHMTQIPSEDLVRQVADSGGSLRHNLVVLPGLKQLPSGCGKALAAFVQAGGGLLLFLGDGISANRYNQELRELLPAQVGKPDALAESGSGWRIGDYDTNTAVFAVFRRPNTGDLRIPEFTQRYTLVPGPNSKRLADFDDGVPLLLTRSLGPGRIALVNTTADTSWNDWPKHKTYVPWLHSLVRYLTQRTTAASLQETNSFTAGEDFELEMGAGVKHSQVRLQSSSGQQTLVTTDSQGRLRDPALEVPGVYALREAGGKELRRIAVNLPAEESDLGALRPLEFQQQLARVQEPRKTSLGASLFGSLSNRREYGSVLLLGALALLIVEAVVANRMLA